MNGYKASGDWTDVTSMVRNEVVFEGRHKAYGAFYIRQRYPNALLFAFLSAITFIALCGVIPYALRSVNHTHPPTKPDDVVIKPTDVLIHRQVITLPLHPPIEHPHSTPPVAPHSITPPVIANQPDSITSSKPDNHTVIVPPAGNPGSDNNAPGLNPLPPSGNPLPPVSDKPLMWVAEMPKFPGGNIEDYLGKQLIYPAEEAQLEIQGTVYASFIIEKDGSVSNVKIERGISNGPGLNAEAVRVLSEMPKWTPGKQDGHPVRIQYVVPIRFKLQ